MKLTKSNPVWNILLTVALPFAFSGLAFGQYGGTGGTGTGTPGYVAPAGGYKASTGLIIAGVAAAGGVLGYLLLRHRDSALTGCVASSGSDATLTTSDHRVFTLAGDSADLKPGEHVKVSGTINKDTPAKPSFLVHKLDKDLGACS